MKFLIFKSNKPDFKVSSRHNMNTSIYDLEESYDNFLKIVSEDKYKYVYLIADFGTVDKKQGLFDAVEQQENLYRMNWIIICKKTPSDYYDPELFIVKNCVITLKLKGFAEYFVNNLKALERFMYYVDIKQKCDMSIKFIEYGRTIDKKLSFTGDVVNKKTTSYCKRYWFKQLYWKPIIERNKIKR